MTNTSTDISKEYRTMIDELAAEIALPPLLPDDITARRLAEKAHKSHKTTKDFLDKKVLSGELICVKCVDEDGRRVSAYRKP